jgi:hypothetical protein
MVTEGAVAAYGAPGGLRHKPERERGVSADHRRPGAARRTGLAT